MLAELGLIALLCGLTLSCLLSVIPLIGIYRQQPQAIIYAVPLSYGVCFFVVLSMLILSYAFAVDDFSLLYVAQHSNTQLPLFFKLAAVWAGHEGSMLFWIFALSLWLALFASRQQKIDQQIQAMVLAILAMIILALGLFVVLFSNPFTRVFPALLEGRDLNPMLQDIGLIIHPPLLYLGYTGFAINFAFACSALLTGRIDAAIAYWSRRWALAAWLCLSIGIMLGAIWAYYELGWGGWWFWDPVENASLMPWLLGTALLHSLIATERRGCFGYWTVLLSIFTFAMSLLGTFIVRSGILTSVHAFAIDSERGVVLLLLLGLATLGPLILFALKARLTSSVAHFSLLSIESALLFAITLLTIAVGIVLLGTFYPMVFNLFGLGSISVGAPYFNITFGIPLAIALLLMGITCITRWKITPISNIKTLRLPLLLAIVLGNITPWLLGQWHSVVALYMTLAIWVIACHLLGRGLTNLRRLAISLAHSGVAVMVIGSVLSGYYTSQTSVQLAPTKSVKLAGYQFTYQDTQLIIGPNYTAEQAIIKVTTEGDQSSQIGLLKPERRHYTVRAMLMSEPGIVSTLLGDFYAVMGEKINQQNYAIRLYYKPFIAWIWFGGLLVILGGILMLINSFGVSNRLLLSDQQRASFDESS